MQNVIATHKSIILIETSNQIEKPKEAFVPTPRWFQNHRQSCKRFQCKAYIADLHKTYRQRWHAMISASLSCQTLQIRQEYYDFSIDFFQNRFDHNTNPMDVVAVYTGDFQTAVEERSFAKTESLVKLQGRRIALEGSKDNEYAS